MAVSAPSRYPAQPPYSQLRTAAIPQDSPHLWVFVLEARPLPDTPDFEQFGGAYVLCYQMPGLSDDPIRHASNFLREAGWRVIGIEEEPEQITREEAPDDEHFDQVLIDNEAYIFHQWSVEDMDDETRH